MSGRTWTPRPAGAVCVSCETAPARVLAYAPDRAGLYCSDQCRRRLDRRRYATRWWQETRLSTRNISTVTRDMRGGR